MFRHVHFAPVFDATRRHSSDSLDSIPESQEHRDLDTMTTASIPQAESHGLCKDGHEFVRDHSQTRQTCACGKVRHSDLRHAAHTIPSGKTRRESVESFEDVKRRWYLELVSDQSAVVDEPCGFDSIPVPALSTKFGVHHW